MFGKKRVSLVLVFLMLLSCFTIPALAEDSAYATREYTVHSFVSTIGTGNLPAEKADLSLFADEAEVTPEYADSLSLAVGNGLLKGYEDNTLRPKATIRRVEALALLSRALPELDEVDSAATFSDIPDWAVTDIERLAKARLVLGYGDGTFGADDLLTVEQVGFVIERLVEQRGNSSEELRLEDDFYAYVNQDYLANTEIQEGYSQNSVLFDMQLDSFYKLNDIMADYVVTDKPLAVGTTGRKMQDFYYNLADSEKRDQLGVMPVSGLVNTIDNAKTIDELIDAACAVSYYTGQETLLNLSVSNDILESGTYALYLGFGSSILAKEEINGNSNPEIPAAFQKHLADLFFQSGYSKTRAEQSAKDVFNLCKELADASMDVNKVKDPADYYTVYSENQLAQAMPRLNPSQYFKMLGISHSPIMHAGAFERVLVADVNLAKKMDSYLTNQNLQLLKDYCIATILMDNAPYLSQGFLDSFNEFYSVRFGVNAQFTPVDIAANVTQDYFAWFLGEEYVARYSSEQATDDVNAMLEKIKRVYKGRINQLDWMSDATKKEALKKLDTMKSFVNHPDDYTSIVDYVEIDGEDGSGPDNIFAIDGFSKYNNYAFIGEEVGGDGWNAYPQTVNAFYDPSRNSITIPAGILQDPIYSKDASDPENLGAIGMIIAHEVSHAFDSTGSLYDENGDRKDWWTEKDKTAFEQRSQALVDQFDKVEVLPGYYIDGEMTLGENMADLTAIRCILDILKGSSQDDLKLSFEKYASIWAEVIQEKALISNLSLDVHSPAKYRVNVILSNFDEFIQCYGITEQDGMYRAAEDRVSIW